MAFPPPKIVGHCAEEMRLIYFARIDPGQRQRVLGASLAGLGPRDIAGVAVCAGDGGYYFFSCDAEWKVMFDSWCHTLEDAIEDTDYEWVYPKRNERGKRKNDK